MSTRLRLTIIFAATLTVALAAVTTSLWLSRRAYVYRDLSAHASAQARLAARVIEEAAQAGDVITEEPLLGASGEPSRRILAPRLWRIFEALPDYLIVVDRDSSVVFVSESLMRLDRDDWTAIQAGLTEIPDDGPAALLNVDGGVLLVARSIGEPTTVLTRVIAGVHAGGRVEAPREYLITVFFLFPLILATALIAVWMMLGKPFEQLQRITDELAAITDGRSLHRRLPVDDSRAELSDLVDTLNAMIDRLEQSFLGLRRFTADASHELKTPLAVLRADVERAMSDGSSKSEKMVALEEALHETARMADLVETLLTLARADEGRFDLHLEPVSLGPIVRDVYETALILGESAQVEVSMPFTAEAVVMGDPPRLRQLFLNLVTNAIKYTPAGGRVDIGLGRHPDHAAFVVRDTGIGIAAADLPYVFDRFWRADRVRSRSIARGRAGEGGGGGSGLGLAISQWIAQAHGGALTVTSRLGKGSLFTVTLPLAAEDAPKSFIEP
ncbi:MAG: HAMP domain-containing histidine kinase [Gemmatimonadaceae bacterium]|nr:HAMP domain-containing histidine kinase [Gemmatimonadaceae bacterium]